MLRGHKFVRRLVFLLTVGVAVAAKGDDLVLSLDYRGDRLQRMTEEPTLAIHADGRVVMAQIYSHSTRYTDELSGEEVAALLQFVAERGFFDAATEAVTPKLSSRSSHASRTIIFAREGERSRRAVLRGASSGPLAEIKARLEQLMTVVKLGGSEKSTLWLDLANEELRIERPEASPLTLENLQSGALRADGSANVVFARADDRIKVSISYSAAGEYGVYVMPGDTP